MTAPGSFATSSAPRALRRLSDRVCLEHDLSVIVNPKLHSKGRYLHYGQWLGENQKLSQKEQIRLAIDAALAKRSADFDAFLRLMEASGFTVKRGRGGTISFLVPGQQRAARLRASTLGDGYDPEDVQAVIDGKAPDPEQPVPAPARPSPCQSDRGYTGAPALLQGGGLCAVGKGL